MAKRLLIIGLDGADLRVIRKMAQKVSMPNLGLLMQEGSCLEVESVLPVNSASAWVSFMTGKYPCRHGIYDFIRKIPGKYELDVIDSFGIKEDAIWDVLDRHGRKSVFVNFPVTYPPKEINGIMISGMLSPGETSAFVYPAVLKKELEDNIGRYLIDVAPLPYLKKNKIKEFISDLFIMTEKRRQAALYCMRKAQWDFSMVLFSGLDRMQHVLWDYLDGEVRLSGDNGYEEISARVRDYFGLIDETIGRMREEAGPDADILVVSDHGFGPLKKRIDLNNWLAQEGLLKFKKKKELFTRMISALQAVGIDKYRLKGLAGILGLNIDEEIRELTLSLIDWQETKAFSCQADSIFINLKNREEQGSVCGRQEYESVIEDITKRLLELTDPQTGQKVVKKLFRPNASSGYLNMDGHPDLLLADYDRQYLPVWRQELKGIGKEVFIESKWQKGSHRIEGLLVAGGPGIKKVPSASARIIDVFPTALALLGLPIPEDLDGRVISEIMK